MSKILAEIQKLVPAPGSVAMKGKDILVKSKDRAGTATAIHALLKKMKVPFKEMMKVAKSSSFPVTSLEGVDIIHKPVIAKGAGGVSFEKELAADLRQYLNGADIPQLRHADVIAALKKELGIKPNTTSRVWDVVDMGSQNQKRTAAFNGEKIVISNNTGKTLTDITLQQTKGGKDTLYLSLKMSSSYYIMNVAVGQHFADKVMGPKICEYFGFDGLQMGGFGKQFVHKTKPVPLATIKKNLEQLITNAYGSDLVLVHKKGPNDVYVKQYPAGTKPKVRILEISEESFMYPIAGQRKYANIKTRMTIEGKQYAVNFQFRGTTAADVGPKYLRILMAPE